MDIGMLGGRVVRWYESDKADRFDWAKRAEEGMKVARQETETKTHPWPGAANVKWPMIATSAVQFAARAYPHVVPSGEMVKCKVWGDDPSGERNARAKRVAKFMSWQLSEKIPGWVEGTDSMLHGLPVLGMYFRKTFWDPVLSGVRSEAVSPMRVYVPMDTRDIDSARRITQELYLYRNDVVERERAGIFLPGSVECMRKDEDKDDQEMFLECHTWVDVDEDGYAEPVIVTVHHESQKVVRVVPRYTEESVRRNPGGEIVSIDPEQYWTKYGFIPDPAGSFYDVGYAHMLGPLNETLNTLVNQLLDAGALANCGGGFLAKGLRWGGGEMRFRLGEWKVVDTAGGVLKDSIVPLPIVPPSSVLLELFGVIREAGGKLAAVSEAMTGEMPGQNLPATSLLATLEQGLKVFSAIYLRLFRALKNEYQKIFDINAKNLSDVEYMRVVSADEQVFRADFANGLEVVPIADPTAASEAQKLAKARAILDTMQANPVPEGRIEILRRYYDAIDVPGIEMLLPPEAIQKMLNAPPPPDPDMVRAQAEIIRSKNADEQNEHRLLIEQMKAEADVGLILAQTEEVKTRALKNIAEAEAKEAGAQLDQYAAVADRYAEGVRLGLEQRKIETAQRETDGTGESTGREKQGGAESGEADGEGGMAGVAPPPTDEGVSPAPELEAPVPAGVDGGGGVPQPGLPGEDIAGDVTRARKDLRAQFVPGAAPSRPGG